MLEAAMDAIKAAASGVYLARFVAGPREMTQRLVLMNWGRLSGRHVECRLT